MPNKILIVDDHPLFRQALVMAALNCAPDCEIIEAGTIDSALDLTKDINEIILILLDLKMPGTSGFSGVALIHSQFPKVPILIISSAQGEKNHQDATRFGAVGFLSKDNDLPNIELAISNALNGIEIPNNRSSNDIELDNIANKISTLTPMQLKVLIGVLNGRLNKQIAYDLSISEATVKAHMTAIFKKLDVGNRTQAALAAKALGIGI